MNTSELRYRLTGNKPSSNVLPGSHDREQPRTRRTLPISVNYFILYLLILTFLYVVVVWIQKVLPTPLTMRDEHNYPSRFIAERARNHVLNLTRMGPRPVGSIENEILAVNLFRKEFDSILMKANKVHRIVYDLQKVSGSYPLTFLDGMTNVYQNVQNVVMKVGPQKDSVHSLLVNCHFDTAIDSPGGSDDGASCAVMLEILRIISLQDIPLKYDIIFLFNGAEENFMQASHGFITQHKWAKNVRAFVNLESCGAGGREILFQAGPEHPWLIQAYSDSAEYPLASSLAQEIFQSGLVPGDTDYRMFRDFGKVSGLDFAWSSNGYVYHTRLDDIHQIPLGTLQNTGDNMLPLILNLVNSDYLSNVDNHRKGNLVFFDVLGIFMITGKELIAMVINSFIIIASLYSLWYNMRYYCGISSKLYFKGLKSGILFIISSWILTLIVIALLATCISILNRALSWFARPVWIFFLYIIPTFLTPVFIAQLFKKKFIKLIPSELIIFQLYTDSNICIFTAVSFCLTVFQVRSNFIVSIWLFFSFLCWLIKIRFTLLNSKNSKQLWLHSVVMFAPFVMSIYIINGVSMFLVPIMGRSGSGNHAELVLSLIMSFISALLFSFYIPITLIVQNLQTIVRGLIALFVTAFLILLFTPLGFPYSGDLAAPAPQRYIISHVDRVFYDINGSVRKNDSGFWLVNLDVNSPRMVEGLVPEITRAVPIRNCDEELYCGLPYIIPVMTIMWDTHWIPSIRPHIPMETNMNLTYRDNRINNVQRLSFIAKGPDHMTLFVSPYPGVELSAWSFDSGPPLKGPPWKNRSTYFVYYSHGLDPPSTWNFWMDFIVSEKSDKPIVDIGFSGYFVHGAYQVTPQLKKLFSQFPPWTVTSGWTAAYKSYTF